MLTFNTDVLSDLQLLMTMFILDLDQLLWKELNLKEDVLLHLIQQYQQEQEYLRTLCGQEIQSDLLRIYKIIKTE